MTRYNSYNRGSSTWKLKAAAGALVLAGGVAGGVALTHHSSTAVHDTAFQFGFGQNGYGPMLDSAMNGLAFQGASGFTRHRSLEELGAFQGFGRQFNFWSHHRYSHLAFERGQIVFISHHFLVVRSLDGRLTVWQMFGNTMVEDVAPTGTTGTVTPPATPPATPTPTITPPVSATPTVHPTVTPTGTPTVATTTPVTGMPVLTSTTATQAVTGGVPVASMVGSTTAAQQPGTTTISVTTGGTTITITITSTTSVAPMAKVTTPTTTTTVPTTSLTWNNGLAPGDLVFVSGHVRGHRHLAELVLVESTATTTTPTASPTVSALPTTTPTHTVTPTMSATPTVTPTLTPTVTPTPTAPVTPAPTPTTSTPAAG